MGKPHYRAVIVSPHLDDAVFSCGSEIIRLAEEGPVLVVNLFTRYLSEVKVRAVVLGAERYEEEQAAATFLGFESHNFGELDVSFRREAYRSLGNIFRPPVREDLGDYLVELRARVFAYLDGTEYDQLYVPLGIGWHVDHVLTYLLFEPWIGRPELLHYEDAPYCLLPHSTRYRLDELGTYTRAAADHSLVPVANRKAWRATAAAYARTALMRNLKPSIVRWAAGPVVGGYLYRLMAHHARLAAASSPRLRLEALIVPSSDHAASRKLDAMALYGSQFREFFSDSADCRNLYTSYAARVGDFPGPIERYWRVAPLE